MRKVVFWLVILPVILGLSLGTVVAQPIPQGSVQFVVNRDNVNIRMAPALGADIAGTVNAGYATTANGRSPDSQWLRIDFQGQEAWVGVAVITVLSGDVAALPVGDPRTIPYGGFESPRAGASDASSPISGRLAQSGLRLRAGPSTAYPILANPLRYTVFPLTGRTANNGWLQVNFEGTLGWVVTRYVEIQNGANINDLPIDGIVASAPPQSEETLDNYIGVLQFMLDRVNIAQTSLDQIRGTWTTVALGERAACQNFPARPTDVNIAQPILAAFYTTLEPLRVDFNAAMANVRLAIDLWLEACRQPQPPSGIIGEATVIGALNAIQAADGQFADLRARLTALLPSFNLQADECLFTFDDQFDILKIINKGQLVVDKLTPRKFVTGYCFDANAGDAIRVELLQINGNLKSLVSISPFDNPTNFLGVGRNLVDEEVLTLGPINITATGRYLLVISDTEENRIQPLQSEYALLVTNIAGLPVVNPGLGRDPNTGQVVVNPIPVSTSAPLLPLETATPAGSTVVTCPSLTFTCVQFTSCAEAQACLAAGNFTLDPDGDSIPCEENLCQ
ncbi:MAG: SH3 domain-containing protein [Anaerolineae bacterium]|nr:SH3 domain-containing protein [Anaerolineae bacterium]